jgi:hypothetical protein
MRCGYSMSVWSTPEMPPNNRLIMHAHSLIEPRRYLNLSFPVFGAKGLGRALVHGITR